jgi:hypothetical protein
LTFTQSIPIINVTHTIEKYKDMIYWKYNSNKLIWEKNVLKTRIFWTSISLLIIGSFIFGRFLRFDALEEYEKELIVLNIKQEEEKFTKEKFVE